MNTPMTLRGYGLSACCNVFGEESVADDHLKVAAQDAFARWAAVLCVRGPHMMDFRASTYIMLVGYLYDPKPDLVSLKTSQLSKARAILSKLRPEFWFLRIPLRQPVQVSGLAKALEDFPRRRVIAAGNFAALINALLILWWHSAVAPPGRLVISRPHLTRGPNFPACHSDQLACGMRVHES